MLPKDHNLFCSPQLSSILNFLTPLSMPGDYKNQIYKHRLEGMIVIKSILLALSDLLTNVIFSEIQLVYMYMYIQILGKKTF